MAYIQYKPSFHITLTLKIRVNLCTCEFCAPCTCLPCNLLTYPSQINPICRISTSTTLNGIDHVELGAMYALSFMKQHACLGMCLQTFYPRTKSSLHWNPLTSLELLIFRGQGGSIISWLSS